VVADRSSVSGRFLPVFFLLLIHGTVRSGSLDQALQRTWKYAAVTDARGLPFKQVGDSDYLTLGIRENERFFAYDLEREGIHATGTWLLEDSVLVLTYDLKPAEEPIDSLSLRITGHDPGIAFFHGGREVAAWSHRDLQSPRPVRRYAILRCDDTGLRITENGVVFSFTYDPGLPAGGFRAGSILRGLLGMAVLLALLWLFSNRRSAISWKLVGAGLALQAVFAVLVLRIEFVKSLFEGLGRFFIRILDFTKAGSSFVFGGLVGQNDSLGFVFAFQILPTILFFSALTSLFFYLGILQRVVYGFAWVLSKTMRLSGAESLSAAGNIFLGQTESPLLVKPYLDRMTRSELLCVMVGGMATIAGGVMAAYIGFLGGEDAVRRLFYAKHLMAASVMSAPAAVVCAKMLFPQTETISERLELTGHRFGRNVLEALSMGTSAGIRLAVNVGAMLIVFIAMIAMINFLFYNGLGEWTGWNARIAAMTGGRYEGLTLQFLLGYVGAPLAWLMGTCREDMVLVGQLLGEKTILNEFVAYTTLGKLYSAGAFAEEKSVVLATYILCGFSNFASIGIQIGGIGALAPGRRTDLAALGLRALLGGTIASLFTAVVVGMLM